MGLTSSFTTPTEHTGHLLRLQEHHVDLIVSYWLRTITGCGGYSSLIDEAWGMLFEDPSTQPISKDPSSLSSLFPFDLIRVIHQMLVPQLIFNFSSTLQSVITDPSKYIVSKQGKCAWKSTAVWTSLLCEPPLTQPGFYALSFHVKCPSLSELQFMFPDEYHSATTLEENYFYIGFLSDFPEGWIQDGCSLHQNNQVHPPRESLIPGQRRSVKMVRGSTHVGVAIQLRGELEPSVVTFSCQRERTKHLWIPRKFPVYVGYCGYQRGLTITLDVWDGESDLSTLPI